jgi:hypothetical protein
MVTTLDIVGAFILGGLVPFCTLGSVIGYYWARADIRRTVFTWFHTHWPDDYHAVCDKQF